jgi:ABC-type multidrug transport system fused ATPase/permease subunit
MVARSEGRARSMVRGLASLFGPYRLRLLEIVFYLLLKLATDLVVPLATKVLIDEVIPARRFSSLSTWCAVVFGAFAIGSLATYRWSVVSGVVSTRVVCDLRARCLAKMHALSVRFHAKRASGDLLSILTNDVDRLEGIVERILPSLVFETSTLIVVAGVAIRLNGPLAFMVLGLGAPLFAAMYFSANRRLGDASHVLQNAQGALTGIATEQLHNQLAVKALALEPWANETFARYTAPVVTERIRVARLGAALSGGTNFVYHGMRFFVLGVGAIFVVKGSLTTGALVAFFTLVGGLIAPFISITDEFTQLKVAEGAFSRVDALLGAEEEVVSGAVTLPPLAGEIRLEDITVRHTPDVAALRKVSVVIPAGSFVAVVGPSGSGKSTLLALLARLYDPDEGIVSFDGRDLRDATLASVRGQIAFVPQAPHLFDLTVAENVRLGRLTATDDDVEAALRDARLDAKAELGPEGAATPAGEHGARLSGGQGQRVSVARAFVRNAPVLLLDEATSAVDAKAELAVLDALEARRAHTVQTIVFATHRTAAAERADLVLELDRGALVRVRQNARPPADRQPPSWKAPLTPKRTPA